MSASLTRRGFAMGVGAAVFSAITVRKSFSAPTQEQKVGVNAGAEIGVINPFLHSNFAEHLGSCIYGGLWVGRNSKIPNINGFRRQAVAWLKELEVPVLRWPGGCFAADYHWRDGIGPAAKRRKNVNIHWGKYVEDNSFGTHEFIALCRLIGAQPYLAGNVGSGTPEEMRDWMEYCNYPKGSSLSDERAANGSPEPFNVRVWGVGNESWGCGGNMTGREYAAQFRRFRTYLMGFGETRPFLVACGPSGNNQVWTKEVMETLAPSTGRGGPGGARGPSMGYAMHFYSNGSAEPTKFTVEAMQQQLSSFARVEEAVVQQRALLDTVDKNRTMGLMVDEWGVWDRMIPDEENKYGRLWMQSTMRSAVAGGMGLNVFHRQADKLYMCNIAQTVNVLQSVILAYENSCIKTTSYYAFQLQKPHRSKTAVRVDTGDTTPLGISVSASKSGDQVALTFINPKHDVEMSVNCGITGATASSAKGRLLSHPDYNACNTFENPNLIVPQDCPVAVQGGRVRLSLPPISMASVIVRTA
jgi:alpha-L-arabinofuranosidase